MLNVMGNKKREDVEVEDYKPRRTGRRCWGEADIRKGSSECRLQH